MSKIERHYDDSHCQTGYTRTETDMWGNEYKQHYDNEHYKTGYSKTETAMFGEEYEQHYDNEHNKTGYSKIEPGSKRHYDNEHNEIGYTEIEDDWRDGEEQEENHEFGDDENDRESTRDNDEREYRGSSGYSTSGSYDSYESSGHSYTSSTTDSSISLGWVLIGAMIIFAIVLGIGIWANKPVRPIPSNPTVATLSGFAYVNTQQVNLRSGPGSEYGSVDKFPRGTQLSLLQRSSAADGGSWIKVRIGDLEGWVNEKLIASTPPTDDTPVGWNDFWVKFSAVVATRNKSELKKLIADPFQTVSGGPMSADDWFKTIDTAQGWQDMKMSVESGTSNHSEKFEDIKGPIRITNNRYMVFALQANGQWCWAGVSGD